jgi:hypothetical protein
VSDIDAAVVDSLKALDPQWPIREAVIGSPTTGMRTIPADLSPFFHPAGSRVLASFELAPNLGPPTLGNSRFLEPAADR